MLGYGAAIAVVQPHCEKVGAARDAMTAVIGHGGGMALVAGMDQSYFGVWH